MAGFFTAVRSQRGSVIQTGGNDDVATECYRKTQAMAVTTFAKGLQQGVQYGERRVLQKQLEVRFGALNLHAQERLESLSLERLEELRSRILKCGRSRNPGSRIEP